MLNLKQPKTQDIISLPATSLLGKVVNEKGIVLVGKNLLFFSRQYTKVLTDFKGSLNEIDKLVNATQASETSGLYVKRNEIYSTEISSANARKYNSFNQYNYGNTILLLTTNGGSVGYATGYVRGYVDGVRNNYPTDFCPNPDGSTYVCGWEYSYSVTTHADFYLNDYGVVSGYTYGIQITWTTDRGNGSGYGSASICSSGSGAYGISGVTPFSDIEGTVNFSFGVNNAGYPTYSNASISL